MAMRITAVLAIACLLALAFAGCSGKDKDGGTTSSSSSSSSRSSTSATSSSSSHSSTGTTTGSSSSTSTGPSSNSPPSGSISATTNGTLAAFALNGTDPDGDALSWTLAFGDGNSTNGTALPTTASHNYTASGNFTAAFTVSDGKDSVAYNVTLTVAAGGGGTFFVFSGAVKANCATQCEGCDPASSVVCAPVAAGAFGCGSFNAGSTPVGNGAQGNDCIWTALPDGAAGRAFTAASTAGDPDLDFIDVCNVVDGANTKSSWSAGPEAGTVPAGFPCVVIWEFTPLTSTPSTITFTIA
jgi:hypothetical protein